MSTLVVWIITTYSKWNFSDTDQCFLFILLYIVMQLNKIKLANALVINNLVIDSTSVTEPKK